MSWPDWMTDEEVDAAEWAESRDIDARIDQMREEAMFDGA